MILRPKNLMELDESLRKLPPEKRKVIILTGRHPNEGTFTLARRHHEEWEKHGAVAVCIPRKWSPQGFWADAMNRNLSPEAVRRNFKLVPNDLAIVRYLHTKGFDVPVLNFHGAPMPKSVRNHLEFSKQPNTVTVEYFFRGAPVGVSKVHTFAKSHRLENVEVFEHREYLEHYKQTKESIAFFSKHLAKKFEEYVKRLARTGLKQLPRYWV